MVFRGAERVAVAATMPDPKAPHGAVGKTPAQRADGPSACPGSSLHERDKRRHQRRLLGHAASRKIHRVRSAGVFLLPWWLSLTGSRRVPGNGHAAALCLVAFKAQGAMCVDRVSKHVAPRAR